MNDKFYVITGNVVTNIIVCSEEYAAQHALKRAPIHYDDLGTVDLNWTYLPNEDRFLCPPRDILSEWIGVRAERDSLLAQSDLLLLPDIYAKYTEEEKQALLTYRQILRDIPQNFIDPKEVIWPVKPF